MKHRQRWGWLGLGLILGALGMGFYSATPKPVLAGNDRTDDCIMCTGSVVVDPRNAAVDAVWLLDYRAGKLLGTLVDRSVGKAMPFQPVDLVKEFNIAPRQDVHFMMTTGMPVNGQTALYVAETVTGKFAIYTMGPHPNAHQGVIIRRHDTAVFRP